MSEECSLTSFVRTTVGYKWFGQAVEGDYLNLDNAAGAMDSYTAWVDSNPVEMRLQEVLEAAHKHLGVCVEFFHFRGEHLLRGMWNEHGTSCIDPTCEHMQFRRMEFILGGEVA